MKVGSKGRRLFKVRLDREVAEVFARANVGEDLTHADVDVIMHGVSPHYTFRTFVPGCTASGLIPTVALGASGFRMEWPQRLLGRCDPILRKDEGLSLHCKQDRERGDFLWAVTLGRDGVPDAEEVLFAHRRPSAVDAARDGGLALALETYRRMPADPWADVECCLRAPGSPEPWTPAAPQLCEKQMTVVDFGMFNERDRCAVCGRFIHWEPPLVPGAGRPTAVTMAHTTQPHGG